MLKFLSFNCLIWLMHSDFGILVIYIPWKSDRRASNWLKKKNNLLKCILNYKFKQKRYLNLLPVQILYVWLQSILKHIMLYFENSFHMGLLPHEQNKAMCWYWHGDRLKTKIYHSKLSRSRTYPCRRRIYFSFSWIWARPCDFFGQKPLANMRQRHEESLLTPACSFLLLLRPWKEILTSLVEGR